MKTIIEMLLIFLGIAGFFITVAQADASYDACVSLCYLDAPDKGECVEDEIKFWDVKNSKIAVIERSCNDMIRDYKINCQIDCMVGEIQFSDHAVEYHDSQVKNFPLTRTP